MINQKKNNEQKPEKRTKNGSESLKPHILDQEQLVYVAINVMTIHHCRYLPLQKGGRYIGNLWLKDLLRFIKSGSPELACHKLNYDLYSAFYMINKSKYRSQRTSLPIP